MDPSQLQQNQQPDDGEAALNIDFGRYWAAVRKYKWIIASLVAVAVTGSVLYTNRQTPIYEATATLMIEPRMPDLLGQGQDIVQSGAGGGPTAEYYRAQMQILRSFQLMQKTVEANDLQLKLVSDAERVGLTQVEAVDLATRRLRDAMKISYPEQNRVMHITVRNPDPSLAADIANAHLDTYVAYTKGLLSQGTAAASKWLANELDTAEKQLRDQENKLIAFQRANNILAVSLEDRQTMTTANITRFTTSQNDAHAHRIELESLLGRMKKLDLSDVVSSPIFGLSANGTLESLKEQYYLERNKFLEVSKEVGPKNPEYQKQQAKVDDLHAALATEAGLAITTLEEQLVVAESDERQFAAEVEKYRQEAFDLEPKIVEYSQLLRDKKSDEDKYNILVARLGTSDLSSRLDTVNVTPLDRARAPEESVYPKMRSIVLPSGAVALLFGIGLAFLLTFLDRSIKSAEDAQVAANSPVLGIIPMLADSDLSRNDDKERDLFVFEHPTSRVAECCRSLRTNIMFSGADRPFKTLVVSSPNPREGKTTSVMYLGTTLAQGGQRVLLVDSDMRRPRLHQSTGIPRQNGLSSLILGEVDYDDVIKTTSIPNLFVLPCGALPPNPAELLMTHRFAVVLEELGKRFDRILLDSPPVRAVTDAVVLSKLADGVILVVRAGKTLRDDLATSSRQIASVGGSIVGVILNELDMEERGAYYYRYYGYGKENVREPEPAA